MRERKKPSQSWIWKSREEIEKEAFNKGWEAGFAKVCDKLRELKSAYEKDLYAKDIPAWSLHRLIEILDTNPCVFYTNCGYDNIIDRIEDYIKEGFIDTRYLEEWCLNEEE